MFIKGTLFMNVVLISLVTFLLIIAFGGLYYSKKKKLRALQLSGVEQVEKIKLLISLLQSHRGLSAAKCQNDSSVDQQLMALKNKIQQQSSQLNQLMPQQERWLAFTDHWQRLATDQRAKQAENNFKQHTHMIANVIYLLEDVAQHHALNMNELPNFKHVSLVWGELVNVIECVGQSRAVGTGAVTAGRCNSVELIRLKFLVKHINELSDTVLDELKQVVGVPKQLINESNDKIDQLTTTISAEIIHREKIEITRVEYFELATTVMEVLNQVFDNQVQQLKGALNQ